MSSYSTHSSSKIAIIGAGSVGATIALECLTQQVCAEIILNDIDEARAKAQVLDLQDAAFTSDIVIRYGSSTDAATSDLIILTAGAKQKDGETRVDLIGRNKEIFKSIFKDMGKLNEKAIVLVVSNPCDMMTYFAQKMCGLPHKQVIGSGTYLDTMRLRSQLSKLLKISGSSIEANVLGEHGDGQFVNWSAANVAGVRLDEVVKTIDGVEWGELVKEDIAKTTLGMAYKIIKQKGVTQFGIAAVSMTLAQDILLGQHHVRIISSYSEEDDVYYGMPVVLGRTGVQRKIEPSLSEPEKEKLKKCIKDMKDVIEKNKD